MKRALGVVVRTRPAINQSINQSITGTATKNPQKRSCKIILSSTKKQEI
jgi:hypothetical protein